MRYFLTITFLFASCAVFAQSNHYYRSVNDFTNTFEINVRQENSSEMAKCQAVRLSKDWYITAAHCLKPLCDRGCEIKTRLLVGKNYEMDITTTHKFTEPAVFLHERAKVDQKVAEYDLALIEFKPEKSKVTYFDPETMFLITKADFLERLSPFASLHKQALEGTNIPPIMQIETQTPKMLNRTLAVISIWDGDKKVLQSTGPVFYSPKLHYIYTENFGIRQGISGSGVMATTGELVGIVSSTAEITTIIQDDNASQKRHANMSFMASFDTYVLDFIKRHVSGLTYKKADMTYLKIVPDNHRPLTDSMEKIES